MSRRVLAGAVVSLSLATAVCGGNGDGGDREKPRPQSPAPAGEPRTPRSVVWPAPDRYEPEAVEGYPNGKRLAARIAAIALTYPRGASARDVARRLGSSRAPRHELVAAIAPAVDPAMASSANVVYPQLAGVTPTSLGAMVVVRQRLRGADGRSRSMTRVVDVRLRRDGGPWRLDRIGSVGGRAVRRPADLSKAARRVIDNARITLSDSARWDVYRGDIDEGLLEALTAIAGRQRISVSVLRSGHPREVWETSRPSAHSAGYAADIYAVSGQLVVRQQEPGSPAHALASSLVADGAWQVGSPWVIPPGGARSFSDDVHRDHIHVQWSTMS
jgi:hypothetical protein